jgi:hypothetical protein
VLTDASLPRPLGKPKSWEPDSFQTLKGEIGRRKMLSDFVHPNRGTFTRDEYGLQKAYENTPTTGTYYDEKTRTLYIRGSQTKRDWIDNFTRLPNWGESHDIEMYHKAEDAYNKLIMEGKPVDRVVGHSLGGAMALQLQKDKDIPLSRTFGAPVLDIGLNHKNLAERYRHPADPVSILDTKSHWGNIQAFPHTYAGFKAFDEPAPYLLDVNAKTTGQQTNFVV